MDNEDAAAIIVSGLALILLMGFKMLGVLPLPWPVILMPLWAIVLLLMFGVVWDAIAHCIAWCARRHAKSRPHGKA